MVTSGLGTGLATIHPEFHYIACVPHDRLPLQDRAVGRILRQPALTVPQIVSSS